jgi:hypothetical protein
MEHHIDPLNPSIEQGIEFLTTLFDAELGYSSINTARSALSSILPMYEGRKFGEHPLVTRFLKGIFELKLALPRYPEIWDVQIVLDHLQSYKPGEELFLKELTLKLTMLLCLLTAQRCQTIHLIDVNDIQVYIEYIELHSIKRLSKQGLDIIYNLWSCCSFHKTKSYV